MIYVSYTNGFEITDGILDDILYGNAVGILSKALSSYNTCKMVDFKTMNKGIVHLPILEEKNGVDIIKELDYVSNSIINGQTIINRTPIMYLANKSCNEGTFIEIDKEDKILYVVKDRELIMDIPIVKGIDGYKPLDNGVYNIISKQRQGEVYLGNWRLKDGYPKIRFGLTLDGIGIQNLGYVDNRGSISIEPSKSIFLYSLVDINTPVYVY